MSGVPPARRPSDTLTVEELCRVAGREMVRSARRGGSAANPVIEFEREVDVEDPPVRAMLGRTHRVKVRVTVRAISLLFEGRDTSTKRFG